jgi:hypothetical protein
MPQENSGRKVKSHQQMYLALELRASGASFRQIGEALGVSKPRAFRIVRKALDELVEHCTDTAERVRQLELHRLDRYRLALDSRKSDPRTVDTLIRISERVAKLHGLDAPQRIEASGPNGGPIETEATPDYHKLSLEDKLQLEALLNKTGVASAIKMFKDDEMDLSRLSVEELHQMMALYEKAQVRPALPAGS